MKDRRVGAVLAAVAALCAAVVTPGQALAAPDGGGADASAYRTEGKPIEGASSGASAPSVTAHGNYVDSIAAGQTRYYRVTLDGSSPAYFSAVAAPPPGSAVSSFRDGIEVTLKSPDGAGVCDSTSRVIEADGGAYPLADSVSRQVGMGLPSCRHAGHYIASVQRKADGTSGGRPWPLELHLTVEQPAKHGTATQPPSGTWNTSPPALPDGTPQHRTGGAGFDDARTLDDGVWSDRLRPGETRFYRVRADGGQQVFASAELPASGGASGGASTTGGTSAGLVSGALGLRVYNPARGLVTGSAFTPYGGRTARSEAGTVPVAYRNRYSHDGRSVRGTCLSGWYYLAVTVSPDLAAYFKDTVPLTLRVEVGRGASGGTPEHQGGGAVPGPSAPGSDAAAGGSDGPLRAVAYTAFGVGTLLLLVLAGWAYAARRRPTAAAPGHKTPA